MSERPHVVIVGGGFGGLRAAKELGGKDVRVTLLDRTNHHTFQPLLYQVATAGLSPADIAVPIRRILRKHENVTVLLADVVRVDVPNKRVHLEDGEPIAYDFLVVATGATHSYFGNDQFAEFAPGLKTVDEGLMIRERIFMAYEEAEREEDPARRDALLTFVVIGAGPTGVEMAGALSEIARKTLAREFRRIDTRKARVILVEGGARVLSSYSADLSDQAMRSLHRLGVEVRLGARVTHVDAEGVSVGDELIPTRTVVWAAGVAASPLARSLGVPLDKVGRVIVDPELSIPGHPEVYVVGDLAHFEQNGKLVPGVAQGAMQGASLVVANILAQIDGRERRAFRYRDLGSMATIGRAAAVAEIFGMKLSGFIAWIAWVVLHVATLIGFKNRVIVMVQWIWAYFTHERGSRLIHGMVHAKVAEPPVLPSKRGKDLASAVTSARAR
ncbi:MAG: NAD(P)/FAD-dependent oxidoreductase [Polyangiaceae bacterium]|nr:NAD(P)/FAD-dependent oxidoreductase [Polyangiaceae bacterium]